MVALVAIERQFTEGTLANKGIQQQIKDVCTHLRCTAERLFLRAFQFTFGKRKGIPREARTAHTKFKDKNLLTSRARKALLAFFGSFNGSPIPSTG